MSTQGREPSEEELRAAYEAELKRLRVEHVLLDNVAALANLGMRRTGLAPGTESERDPEQVRLAIESLRALMPVLEQAAPAQVPAIRDAVSQLQMAFVRIGGQAAAAAAPDSRKRAGGRCAVVRASARRQGSQGRHSAAGASGCRASSRKSGQLTDCQGPSEDIPLPQTLKSPASGPPLDQHGWRPFHLCWLRLFAPSL